MSWCRKNRRPAFVFLGMTDARRNCICRNWYAIRVQHAQALYDQEIESDNRTS